jgi:hypothetical protein
MISKIDDLLDSSGNGDSAQESRVSPEKSHAGKLRPVYRLAEAHCANWCRDGSCKGIDFDLQRGGRPFFNPALGGRCLLALDKRCPYFEEAVLPMETRREWPTPLQGEAFRKAARLYHSVFPETILVEPTTRKCPDCGKHQIGPRQRCCGGCRIRRARAKKTVRQRKWRQKAGDCRRFNEIRSSLRADSQGSFSNTRLIDPRKPSLASQTVYMEGQGWTT